MFNIAITELTELSITYGEKDSRADIKITNAGICWGFGHPKLQILQMTLEVRFFAKTYI